MIAALVFIALAASAQVQAFPGSDPIAEALAVLPEHAEHLSLGDDVFCLMRYIGKVKDLVTSGKAELQPLEDTYAKLVSRVKACGADSGFDKVNCGLQAIRDTWEGSAELRQAVLALGEDAVGLVKEIQEKCF